MDDSTGTRAWKRALDAARIRTAGARAPAVQSEVGSVALAIGAKDERSAAVLAEGPHCVAS